MSNSIPHFVSDSPPPIANNDEEDYDDEFGDFTGPGDLSFDNDLSTPSTPKNSNHVVDNFSPFEIDKIEKKYEENIKIDDKSTNNFIRNELPNKNYINILDHIESDALKIVNRDKEDILKENNTVKGKFKEFSTENVLNETNFEENEKKLLESIVHFESSEENEKNLSEDIVHIESPEETEKNLSEDIVHIESPEETESVKVGLPISYVVSIENPDIVNNSVECDLRKKTEINNFCEKPSEQLSAIVDDCYNSEYCFAKFSTFIQDNINLNIDLDTDSGESIRIDVSKQVIHQNDPSVVNLNSEANLFQDISKEEKIVVKYDNETVNSTPVPVFQPENRIEVESKTIDEISDVEVTYNHLRDYNEGIYTCHTDRVLFSGYGGAHQISHSNLEESKIEELQHESLKAHDNCEDDDFGEFADFKSSNFNDNTSVFDIQSEVENREETEDDFVEFGDFEKSKHTNDLTEFNSWQTFGEKTKKERTELEQHVVMNDELDDFADYTTSSKPTNDDDFCNHSAFNRQNSGNNEIPGNIKIFKAPEEAFEYSQIVLKDMFVPDKSGTEDYIHSDITSGNTVFESLKDITETNALMYQWEKSTAQKNILKTLNIDIRNILYGPTWNAGIPIFAANLCSTPLEPIKSEVACSPSPHKPKETLDVDRSKLPTDVPLAEFDWSGAGLTNPLDYSTSMLLDLGELVVDCSPMLNQDWEQSDSPTAEFDSWEGLGLSFEIVDKELETSNTSKEISQEIGNTLVTSVTSSDSTHKQDQKDDISTYSLSYPNNVSICEDVIQALGNEEDFSDFTSYQPSFEKDPSWTGKMLPLRESHISYQPSSIKEELPVIRESPKPSFESATSNSNLDLSFLESKFSSTEIPKVIASYKSENFSDLNLFSLEENKSTVEKPITFLEDVKFKMQSNHQQHDWKETELRSIKARATTENINVISKTTQIISEVMETTVIESNSLRNTAIEQYDQEEEFTDFHSSLPTEFNPSSASKVSFSEPLKPAVLQPVPVKHAAKIEWPEPGLDEDEVSRIVAGCLRRKSENETEVVNKNEPVFVPQNKDIKVTETQNYISVNDDEWSDFVSVKESVKSRTATPDLPLSVFNLGNIQPVKAPTPVLTPNGLICSPVKNSLPNISVPKSNNNLQRNIQHQPQKHPFITSQAFDALYQYPKKNIGLVSTTFRDASRQITNPSYTQCKDQNTNIFDTYFDTTTPNVSNIGYVSQQNETSYGKFQSSYLSTPKNSEDDEEWGDFVSATSSIPPNNSNPNSLHSATRIITNPSHYMGAFNKNVSSDQYSSSNKSTVVRKERRNIPSISALPDLDFVSPGKRVTKK